MTTMPPIPQYTEEDFRRARKQWNRELAQRPLWWAYWKMRHLTWRRRAKLYPYTHPLSILRAENRIDAELRRQGYGQ